MSCPNCGSHMYDEFNDSQPQCCECGYPILTQGGDFADGDEFAVDPVDPLAEASFEGDDL